MELKTSDKIIIGIILLLSIAAFAVYPSLPEKIPIHYNIYGEADGYGSRFTGLFMFPLIMIALFLIFLFISNKYKHEIIKFEKEYEKIKVAVFLFFSAIYISIILPYFGIKYNMLYFYVIATSVFLYYIGYLTKFIKRNAIGGIRTPWTLADDKVWEKTHDIGSTTLRLNALVALLIMIEPIVFFWVFMVSLFLNIIFLYIYSYRLWKKKSGGKL